MKRTKPTKPLREQVKAHSKRTESSTEYDGDFGVCVSTGSTLLDLAIAGGRIRGGGIPAGILVEIFGPSGSGKTVLLSEIAGAVQRLGGQVNFKDPEARLNKQFARIFDLDADIIDYSQPDTVTEVFEAIREWQPKPEKAPVHGVFADSLAALSTDAELEGKDPYGMRRAKELSEQCRLSCRHMASRNLLVVCSNQQRVNVDAGPYAEKFKTPGGEAIGFYASLRLRCKSSTKIRPELKYKGKKIKRVIGVETEVEVYKSSVWKPFRTAPVIIIYDYGIDDIRANLQFVKTFTGSTTYTLDGVEKLAASMDEAIAIVEEENLEPDLKEATIDIWEKIEAEFATRRKPKQR